ncbi:MAG: hypothetical protein RO257_05280 [Candidatus Kapabacteria bacterium]|nr:hypothetical protein [Candidatus Kapabacteria bacterium]
MKKSKENIIENFNAVKFMRDVRDKISSDIQNMNFEELKKYFENRRLHLTTKS